MLQEQQKTFAPVDSKAEQTLAQLLNTIQIDLVKTGAAGLTIEQSCAFGVVRNIIKQNLVGGTEIKGQRWWLIKPETLCECDPDQKISKSASHANQHLIAIERANLIERKTIAGLCIKPQQAIRINTNVVIWGRE